MSSTPSYRLLALASGKCAETVIHLINGERSVDAVKATIDYGNGLITKKELKVFTRSAYAALSATYASLNKKENEQKREKELNSIFAQDNIELKFIN